MSKICAFVEYTATKNCFISLPLNRLLHLKPCLSDGSNDQVDLYLFELIRNDESKVYVSHQSCSGVDANNVKISGLYSEKLGIKCDEEVQLIPLPRVKSCQRVHIEPLSIDDWEILELHASFIEDHLMDQVRVVWVGQVLPVWVTGGSVIYLKTTSMKPVDKCLLLIQTTEIVVAPKDRQRLLPEATKHKPYATNHSRTPSELKTRPSDGIFAKIFPGHKRDSNWPNYILSFVWNQSREDDRESAPNYDVYAPLASEYNLVLRVQGFNGFDMIPRQPSELLGFVCMSVDTYDYVTFPTTVFVKSNDVAQQTALPTNEIPDIFYCTLKKLTLPSETEEDATNSDAVKTAIAQTKSDKAVAKLKSRNKTPPVSQVEFTPVVKVIVVDRDLQSCAKCYLRAVYEVQTLLELCKGHMLVANSLRRQLKLEVTSRIQLSGMSQNPSTIETVNIHVHSPMPANATNETITFAFTEWVTELTRNHGDILVYHQTPVVFRLSTGEPIEAILTIDVAKEDQLSSCRYGLITLSTLSKIAIHVKEAVSGGRWKLADVSHFPVHSVTEFDHDIPDIDLRSLGGISHLYQRCQMHIDLCMRERPLTEAIIPSNAAGVQQGCLFITGARGAGKTSLGRALCSQAATVPPYAYTRVVDCKRMRGKRVDTIEKIFLRMFNEAAWRQPSVILLDDLDHVATASNTPEAEQSGEAHYAARVAHVIRNILKMEAINLTRLCVIITSKSRSSLHQNLVHSRGFHVVHETIEITAPNKNQRQDMFEAILTSQPMVNTQESLKELDVVQLMSRMEGFVANDLVKVVNRAVHAHLISSDFPPGGDHNVVLTEESFNTALEGFTAASMRHISLHKEVELTWRDIGGLHQIKRTLIETIEWPTKYSQLFSNCPLRLRSGILLYGAPGTGKTLLAGVLARECGVNFISIKGPEVLSKYIGASEQAIRDIFVRAQGAKPCVLFFDEFDSIAPRRGHDSTGVTDRVVNQLLTQLDGIESLEGVYVLAATSRPDLIDPALLRPGRLDKCLYCQPPTRSERVEIFTSLSRKMNMSYDVDFEVLSELCVNFTGADIKALLYNAQLRAIRTSAISQKFEYSIENDTDSDSDLDSGINTLESAGGADDASRIQKHRRNTLTESIEEDLIIPHKFIPLGSSGITVDTGERRMSFSYIPRLQDGIVEVDTEQERQLIFQLNLLKKRVMKQNAVRVRPSVSFSSHLDDLDEEPLVQVNHFHLIDEIRKMQPSVSPRERKRYETMLDNVSRAETSVSETHSSSPEVLKLIGTAWVKVHSAIKTQLLSLRCNLC